MTNQTEKKNQSGSVLIMVAVFMFLLLGFIAAGVEAGRWYLVRAELAKSVDAGALVACSNLSNPNVSPTALAVEYANANFPAGAVGTPGAGTGSATFSANLLAANRVQVNGGASATSIFAQLLGFGLVPVKSLSIAQKRQVEIMLVLDRSGSMDYQNGVRNGVPIAALREAATGFVSFFKTTQAEDKMGMISFATYATVARPLGINFVGAMNLAIAGLTPTTATNSEDAIDQADGPSGLTDQTGVAPESKIAQFVIFFSDGHANSFRYNFIYAGQSYDAVVTSTGGCDASTRNDAIADRLVNPSTGANVGSFNPAVITGDGLAAGSACGIGTTTRWSIFNTYPVAGYAPTACGIPEAGVLNPYVCDMSAVLARLHASELKAKDVTVYSIGYGDIDEAFMKSIASSAALYYKAPKPEDLSGIFQHIALEIKLRLVQ